MAPLVPALQASPLLTPLIGVTAQHRHMLDQVLELFAMAPDFDLDVMQPGQRLPELTARVLQASGGMLETLAPDMVLVHGDTTTTLAVALACFYAGIPVGHVEAGLRSGNMLAPWPEEMNRRLTAPLCQLHFTPTVAARQSLLAEGMDPQRVVVTGNTVIDSLMMIKDRLQSDRTLRADVHSRFPFLELGKRVILVTSHRRENLDGGLDRICEALAILARRNDVLIVYPVHMNPEVRRIVQKHLVEVENIHLIEPLDYLAFVHVMGLSHLILTDSGGIQEEAPSLGKPVLVMRDITERPEALAAGTAALVGSDVSRIVASVTELLDDPSSYQRMATAHNPYGDGFASHRIVTAIERYFGASGGEASQDSMGNARRS